MLDVATILKNAADHGGFVRQRFSDKKVPNNIENVSVLLFLGDLRSTFILSSLLLQPFRQKLKASKYLILCSWPGHESLFPCVDEYWEIGGFEFFKNSQGFKNSSDAYISQERKLRSFFYDVCTDEDLIPFYENGLTQKYFDKFGSISRTLPAVPSSTILGIELNKEFSKTEQQKIFVHPSKLEKIPIDFWIDMVNLLLDSDYIPVVYQTEGTYDLSREFTERCIYIQNRNISDILAAMRLSGCVLDVFSGISKFAIAARCPYVVVGDRASYFSLKEYEIEDLCGKNLPKDRIFGMKSAFLKDRLLIQQIIFHLQKFIPTIDRDNLPTTSGSSEIVSYDHVKTLKARKLGINFIKKDQ